MEITRHRRLVVRMGDYESYEISASVKHEFPDNVDVEAATNRLTVVLDHAMREDIADAQELTTDRKSFIHKIGSN